MLCKVGSRVQRCVVSVLNIVLLLLFFGIEVMLIFVAYIPHYPAIVSDT